MLPSGLPYRVTATAARLTELPVSLQHRLDVSLYLTPLALTLDSPALYHSIPLSRLGSGRLNVHYEPANEESAALIEASRLQRAATLPAYLIDLLPQLRIDDQVVASSSAVSMGAEQYWRAKLRGPQAFISGCCTTTTTAWLRNVGAAV